MQKKDPLPSSYRKLFLDRYNAKRIAVIRAVKNNLLPQRYSFPELSTFIDRLTALVPAYQIMQRNNWQPDIVFVPKGLRLEQWHNLLQGYPVRKDKTTNGAYRTWNGYELVDRVHKKLPLWSVILISAKKRPIFVHVSKDGVHGAGVKQALESLLPLPNIKDTSSAEAIIKQACPSEEQYFALQLSRFERGKHPVDTETWTMGKEDVKVAGGLGSLYFNYGTHHRLVRSVWNERTFSFEDDGIRPTVSDER